MAIFRKGVKVGNQDIRVGISGERAKGLLRKAGIIEDDKGRKKYEKDARGSVQLIRTVVGKGEGFTIPANFKVSFKTPRCINQVGADGGTSDSKVRTGGLDWQTHIMNKSTDKEFRKLEWAAQQRSAMMWNKAKGQKYFRSEQKMDLYCSKINIPEKTFNPAANRIYNHPQFMPQNIQYGSLQTEFYCDGTMDIKNYFDAWQKLIYNDLTGNFNFYSEYVAEIDIFTRTTMASKARTGGAEEPDNSGLAGDISETIKAGTKKLNEITGVDGPRDGKQVGENKIPAVDFRENYGVRIFNCWPSIVSGIDLAHDAGGGIARFNVTWQYEKWNPFKMGNVGNRSTINLAVGEFRNEKDGFPFLEDLPPELSGPLTNAVGQGINTGPLSKASNLLG